MLLKSSYNGCKKNVVEFKSVWFLVSQVFLSYNYWRIPTGLPETFYQIILETLSTLLKRLIIINQSIRARTHWSSQREVISRAPVLTNQHLSASAKKLVIIANQRTRSCTRIKGLISDPIFEGLKFWNTITPFGGCQNWQLAVFWHLKDTIVVLFALVGY